MNEKEKELVMMVLDGDLEAFAPLVNPYRTHLLNLAYRLTQNLEEAKEVCQETLIRVFKYLARYDTRRSFRNWMFQILVNEARNHQKKRTPAANLDLLQPESRRPGPEQEHIQREVKSRLLACLEVLTSREKEVFLLRDIEELSIKESAAILGCSSISVRVHLTAARKKIKNLITERFPHLIEGIS